jgi:hypothetical protein
VARFPMGGLDHGGARDGDRFPRTSQRLPFARSRCLPAGVAFAGVLTIVATICFLKGSTSHHYIQASGAVVIASSHLLNHRFCRSCTSCREKSEKKCQTGTKEGDGQRICELHYFSTFNGTHFVTPRTESVQLGFRF